MILVSGGDGDLFEYVYQKQRLPEAEARLLFWQLLVGLDVCVIYIHGTKVSSPPPAPTNPDHN
jgi:hypothetical protein